MISVAVQADGSAGALSVFGALVLFFGGLRFGAARAVRRSQRDTDLLASMAIEIGTGGTAVIGAGDVMAGSLAPLHFASISPGTSALTSFIPITKFRSPWPCRGVAAACAGTLTRLHLL